MLTFKRLNEMTIDEAVKIWNAGFEGYFTDLTMNPQAFLARLVAEELSPEISFAGYLDDEPAGFILSGIREINGKKIAWNGGTGVCKDLRGKGIGKELVNEALRIYKEHGVDTATLEAMSQNEPAIELYKSAGYNITDELLFLQKNGQLSSSSFQSNREFQVKKGVAQEAKNVKILDEQVPWQTQWQSLRKDGELLVVSEGNTELAYFLFKKGYRPDGSLASIILYQAGINPEEIVSEEAVKYGLKTMFEPEKDCTRMTFNFPSKNQSVVSLLMEEGFQCNLKQVAMERSCS